jgi:hypothetical protein
MDIPTPPQSGSAGTQQPADASQTPPEPYSPLAGLPLAQRFEGLAATRPRNLGGEVAATLIAGSFTQLSEDLRVHREQAIDARAKVAELQDNLGTCRTRAAVLEERLSAVEKTQTVRHVSIFAGTALVAVAIDLYKAQLTPSAVVVGLLGVALLVFGSFSRSGGTKP